MSTVVGRQAAVIGAGIGGLAAAAALAEHFEQVVVLERDALPTTPEHRAGVPQSKHSHIVLGGGQRALDQLFPDLTADMFAAGAVSLRVGLDDWKELPGCDPFPKHDLGLTIYSSSRPLLELTLRQRLKQRTNIALHEHCRVQEIVAADGAVAALRYENGEGRVETLPTDFVVDATGRAAPTLAFLRSTGRPLPEETTIGCDGAANSAVFEIPSDISPDWKFVSHYPKQPESKTGAVLIPIEGNRWMVTAMGVHDAKPLGGEDAFWTHFRNLRTSTIYDAIKHARRVSNFSQFAYPTTYFRHFERLADFPRGLVPLGDAYSFQNPLYGQGMSAAAQEAARLQQVLKAQAGGPDPLAGIAPAFFAEVQEVLETPWANACRDLGYPETQGKRPADFHRNVMFWMGFIRLAVRDPKFNELFVQAQHLLKPRRVFREPEIVERVTAMLATA